MVAHTKAGFKAAAAKQRMEAKECLVYIESCTLSDCCYVGTRKTLELVKLDTAKADPWVVLEHHNAPHAVITAKQISSQHAQHQSGKTTP